MAKNYDEESKPRIRLKIVGVRGEEWFEEVNSVPRVGDRCSIWTTEKRIDWSGKVESVNWCFARDYDGAFVIIQLEDDADDA